MDVWKWLTTDGLGTQIFAGFIILVLGAVGTIVVRKRHAIQRSSTVALQWVRGVRLVFSTDRARQASEARRQAEIAAHVEAEKARAAEAYEEAEAAAVAAAIEGAESRAREEARAAAQIAQDVLRAAVAEERTRGDAAALDAAAAVEARVAEERAAISQPSWSVRPTEILDRFMLSTGPGFSKNVSVSAPATHFVLDGQIHWDEFGADRDGVFIGKQIGGIVTDQGRGDGVTFTVTWRDRNGDPHEAEAFLPPEAIGPLTSPESLEEAFERGVQQGRERVTAERAVTVYPPRWNAVRDPDGERTDFILTNSAEESVAQRVVLHPTGGTDLSFISAAAWDDFSGRHAAEFQALISRDAWEYGVEVFVQWTGSDGERHDERIPLRGTGQY